VAVTASLGIAFSPQQGGGPEGLVGAADRAMYVAKTQGGNRWAFAPAESHAQSLA
jgi:GGDEF domain-containing protein